MRVTDEMVNKALDTLIEYGVLSMDTSIESDTAAARAALEAALSHAAGQDGEQCRAGAGEPVAWIRTDGVTTSDAGLMRHWEAQGLQFDPLIRALSRGVPEGK